MTKKIFDQSRIVGLAASLGLVAGSTLVTQPSLAAVGYTTDVRGGLSEAAPDCAGKPREVCKSPCLNAEIRFR